MLASGTLCARTRGSSCAPVARHIMNSGELCRLVPQVRRKADPAKESVKEFVRRWRDDEAVQWHPSHAAITGGSSLCGAVMRPHPDAFILLVHCS